MSTKMFYGFLWLLKKNEIVFNIKYAIGTLLYLIFIEVYFNKP